MLIHPKNPSGCSLLVLVGDVAIAVSMVGAAFIARWMLGHMLGASVLIFAVCYPAILGASFLRGPRAGTLALILSTLLFWWAFVPPAYSLALMTAVDAVNVVLFGAAGATVI